MMRARAETVQNFSFFISRSSLRISAAGSNSTFAAIIVSARAVTNCSTCEQRWRFKISTGQNIRYKAHVRLSVIPTFGELWAPHPGTGRNRIGTFLSACPAKAGRACFPRGHPRTGAQPDEPQETSAVANKYAANAELRGKGGTAFERILS